MKIISEDEADLAVRSLDCSVSMEGGPSGAVPPKHFSKTPSVTVLEGDPPIGKERGALVVGTGPTPLPPGPKKKFHQKHHPIQK